MRIFATGREGQLVASLAERAALDPDLELVAAGRPELDLEIPGSAAAAIGDLAPDLVINAAAYTAVDAAEDEPERAFRINAEGAGEVAAAAAAAGVPVIHVSTDYVFDGETPAPYPESAPTNPLGVYGRSKLAGEERVRAACARHLIVRTSWVYSPFGRNFVKTMMKAARERDEVRVVADQTGNPTAALDLADGLLAIARVWRSDPERGIGRIFHLAGSGSTSWHGFAAFIMAECARLGLPAARVEPIATADWPVRAPRPKDSTLDCRAFADTFGVTLPHWRESAARTIARLAAQG